ncbi:hypothetical protein PFISCL1PPCAC_3165, partial [Pristionchus fissidentatus]
QFALIRRELNVRFFRRGLAVAISILAVLSISDSLFFIFNVEIGGVRLRILLLTGWLNCALSIHLIRKGEFGSCFPHLMVVYEFLYSLPSTVNLIVFLVTPDDNIRHAVY